MKSKRIKMGWVGKRQPLNFPTNRADNWRREFQEHRQLMLDSYYEDKRRRREQHLVSEAARLICRYCGRKKAKEQITCKWCGGDN